jgi:hypothetical protein
MNAVLSRGPCITAVWVVLAASQACGQNVTVQQPVVGLFNVNTVVSVPDRGSLLLGGVSSAGVVGGSRGPSLPSSQQSGFARHSAARVHVFIHDFETMDRAVLAAAGSPSGADRRTNNPAPSGSQLTGMAAHAHRSLLQRQEHNRLYRSVDFNSRARLARGMD